MSRRDLLRAEVPLAVLAVTLVCLAFVFAWTSIPPWLPPAPLVRLGIPSPLTGMTRSFVALASGDVGAAFSWHPLGPVLFGACVLLPLLAVIAWLRGGRPGAVTRLVRRPAFWWTVGVVCAAAWLRQIVALG